MTWFDFLELQVIKTILNYQGATLQLPIKFREKLKKVIWFDPTHPPDCKSYNAVLNEIYKVWQDHDTLSIDYNGPMLKLSVTDIYL